MTIEEQFTEWQGSVRRWWAARADWPIDALIRTETIIKDRDERVWARGRLEVAEELYHHSKNALHAWGAILSARGRWGGPLRPEGPRLDLPGWVREYLERAAWGLLGEGDRGAMASITRERRRARVTEILGLKPLGSGRKRDAFDRWRDPTPRLELAIELRDAKAKLTHEKARELVAGEYGVSESVVDRAWTRWKDTVRPR